MGRSIRKLLQTLFQVAGRVRSSWKTLLVTDLIFKLFSFVVLTPLLSASVKLTIWLAGDGLMSDADFALLFTHPVGIACGLLVGAIWLGVVSLEQACLLVIFRSRDDGGLVTPVTAIRYCTARSPAVLLMTAIVTGGSLLLLAPFVVVGLLVFEFLLGSYDINFYLKTTPPEFLQAVSIGAILVLAAVASLLSLFSGWILALPILLFEQLGARDALRESRGRLIGRRWQAVRWFGVWIALALMANAAVAGAGLLAGRLLIPATIDSVLVLAARVGVLLIVLAGFSLLIHVFATVTFAALMDTGYRVLRPGVDVDWGQQLNRRSSSPPRISLTRTGLALSLVAGVVVASWVGLQSLASLPLDDDDVVVMAHRGASAEAPENTLAAFALAIEKGADWIELDVQESADGEVLVMHDSDFMKQSGNPLKVWDAKMEDLASVDIGSWFDASFADQRVARLEDVLILCRGRIGVNIELKYYGHNDRLEERVVRVVEATRMVGQVKIMSLNRDLVTAARRLRPNWECGLLLSVSAGNLEKQDVDFLAINSSFASRSFIHRAHQAGKKVYVWTVNDAAAMAQMLNRGVDGLLTDRPALAKRVLAERAGMTLADRMLSELSVWLLNRNMDAEAEP